MKYVLTGAMAKAVDDYTINKIGIPSVVLMERAALETASVVARIAADFGRAVRICAVCGSGNNGADGIAAARILTWQGLPVDIITAGGRGHATEEFKMQLDVAVRSGMKVRNISDTGEYDKTEAMELRTEQPVHGELPEIIVKEYDIIVDAIFGIGLSRNISGTYAKIIESINAGNNVVVSVDIPSGVNSDTGCIMGTAVHADATVTFGYNKQGLMLYPGKALAGEVTVADIGFCPEAIRTMSPAMYFTVDDIYGIPVRDEMSNKGSYGRTLVIAGSENMSGAAYLAAASAYRCGAGIVEILTHESNCGVLRSLLPEAIVMGYNAGSAVFAVRESMKKADTIILGPGLSTGPAAVGIVREVLTLSRVLLIIDADGLNIAADNMSLLRNCASTVIVTPHIGEMARLTGLSKEEILADTVSAARDFAIQNNVICVLKNASTVVASYEPRIYINNSGCGAMSKGGMGDVLTGVIAGMSACRLEPFSAASMGVYVHGLAGEAAAAGRNMHTVLAGDLLEQFGAVMGNNDL